MDFRPLDYDDIEWLRTFRNQEEVWQFFSNAFMVNEREQGKWFIEMSNDPTRQHFLVTEGEEKIGVVWYDEWDRVNRSCRVGISIHPDYQGKGYGSEAFGDFVFYLFNALNLHRVWLLVMEDNKRAVSLYKALGFEKEGVQKEAVWRNGKFLDYIMMAKLNK